MEDTPEEINAASHVVLVSLGAFQREITSYSHLFENAYPKLLAIHEMLTTEAQVWPDQYQYVHGFLQQVYDPLQKLCLLLDDTSKLLPEVVSHCYLLLMALQNTVEQVKKLLPLSVGLFHPHLYSSRQRQRRQQEVKHYFGMLERSYMTMQTCCRSLLQHVLSQAEKQEHISLKQRYFLLLQSVNSYEKAGQEASEAGQKEEARACFERALLLIRKANEPQREVGILNHLGRTYSALGMKDEARRSLTEALELTRKSADS